MPVAFHELFRRPKPLIGMIHTGPTPGAPGFVCIDSAVDRAIAEAEAYIRAGMDGILIENMRDFPCVHEREMGPEVAAFMTRIARAVKRRSPYVPVGIQVLFQGNRTALAVAMASGCDFVRAEGWTHAHVSDKGIAEASAGTTVRYRRQIGADHIPIFADIKKKHASHAWTQDLDIAETAAGMGLHKADGVIVTGTTTGDAPDMESLCRVRSATGLPLLIGSGISSENLGLYMPYADGFIVGSALKEHGLWDHPVCENRVQEMVETAEMCRGSLRTIRNGK